MFYAFQISKKTVSFIYNRRFFRLILKSRYVFLNFTTARILVPTFNKCGTYFWGNKKGPCRILNWVWFLFHTLSYKNIYYAALYYSNLQLTAYNAYISLWKTTNLTVKHIARSHFLGTFLWKNKLSQKSPYGKAVIKVQHGNAS